MRTSKLIISLVVLVSSSYVFAADMELEKLPKINSVAKHFSKGFQYFAATDGGIYMSKNGQNWTPSFATNMPATLVNETGIGELYAFILSKGLMKYDDKSDQWNPIYNKFGSQVLLSLSADSKSPEKMIALNQFGKLIISENSGKDWHSIKGKYSAKSVNEKRGQLLYEEKCQSCHGINGAGETYNIQSLTDKNYIRAPALDASEHAWHHTDEGLIKTILEGSPRTKVMAAWKDAGVTQQNASDLVAYIKSLWTQRELDCQGPKHMQCMQ